jgi:hypothetical protein
MADASIQAQTYTNAGVALAYNTTNFEQLVNTQGLSGNLIVAEIAKGTGSATEAELVAVLKKICNGTDIGATQDAFNVVGFKAATLGTDPAYVLLNGTGTLGTSSGDYGTDITVSIVTTFSLAV